jgi:nucleotide-binding universal stress UspA family protein
VDTRAEHNATSAQHGDRASIVVGVDTRGRSASALVWAVDEADRTGARLRLVTASATGPDALSDHDLGALARRLSIAEVEQQSVQDDAVHALLDSAAHADLLVVGCRMMRPATRLVSESTSRSLACWTPVPVVIVPEAWMQPSMATAPIVAGVRPDRARTGGTGRGSAEPSRDGLANAAADGPLDEEVLDVAFTRANALRVPLIIVSAFEPSWLRAWSPADLARERVDHEQELEDRLRPWKRSHAEVELVTRMVAEPAGDALAEASRLAQLTVVGRHHGHRLSGRLGRTVETMLNKATRPVTVVPHGSRDRLMAELAAHRATTDTTWTPMY